MTTQTQLIEGLLLDYFSNSINGQFFADELCIKNEEALFLILGDAQQEWDAIPSDPEGETEEQNQKSDEVLNKYIHKIIDLINQ